MRRQRRSATGWRGGLLALVMVVAAALFLPPAAAQDEESVTIPLNENENSGVSGTATLAAAGDGVRVSMELAGDPVTGDHPTHIHTGTCGEFDPEPLYPLTTVILDEVSDEGVSETTIDELSLDDLLADDYIILVHPSAEELYPEWVCGDIKADGGDGAEQAGVGGGAGGTTRMPSSGVGSVAARAPTAPLAAALGLLALLSVLATSGLLLRRRWQG